MKSHSITRISGFSLTEVLVAGTILGIALLGFARTISFGTTGKGRMASALAGREVLSFLDKYVETGVRQLISTAGGCATLNRTRAIGYFTGDRGASYHFEFEPSFSAVTGSPGGIPPQHTAAAGRCASPSLTGTAILGNNAAHWYFCLGITPANPAKHPIEPNTLRDTQYVFAEVKVSFYDFSNDAASTCLAVSASGAGLGMILRSTLYSQVSNPSKPETGRTFFSSVYASP